MQILSLCLHWSDVAECESTYTDPGHWPQAPESRFCCKLSSFHYLGPWNAHKNVYNIPGSLAPKARRSS